MRGTVVGTGAVVVVHVVIRAVIAVGAASSRVQRAGPGVLRSRSAIGRVIAVVVTDVVPAIVVRAILGRGGPVVVLGSLWSCAAGVVGVLGLVARAADVNRASGGARRRVECG